jgi:hypothetical protein
MTGSIFSENLKSYTLVLTFEFNVFGATIYFSIFYITD